MFLAICTECRKAHIEKMATQSKWARPVETDDKRDEEIIKKRYFISCTLLVIGHDLMI
jgi:hypothetical protein